MSWYRAVVSQHKYMSKLLKLHTSNGCSSLLKNDASINLNFKISVLFYPRRCCLAKALPSVFPKHLKVHCPTTDKWRSSSPGQEAQVAASRSDAGLDRPPAKCLRKPVAVYSLPHRPRWFSFPMSCVSPAALHARKGEISLTLCS